MVKIIRMQYAQMPILEIGLDTNGAKSLDTVDHQKRAINISVFLQMRVSIDYKRGFQAFVSFIGVVLRTHTKV